MNERFKFTQTPLSGLWIAERTEFKDERGSFSRMFCVEEFQKVGLKKPISQINYSITKSKGIVRGMHYQLPPHAETKIVTCLKGKIFDVAIDLRNDSKTFLSWCGKILSAKNKRYFIIPEGFAHGFQAITNDCVVIYFVTSSYNKESERGLNALDEKIKIDWPIKITRMSDKDNNNKFVDGDFKGVDL